MNSKKNKSKNRSKHSNPTQETVNVAEKLGDIELLKSESLNTEETRVPEIVTESNIITENQIQSPYDVPKKPKRSKGKKKKEPLFEDIKVKEEIIGSTKDNKEILENVENIAEENIQIVPCARKNKKKVKKHSEISECVNLTVVKCTDTDKEKSSKLETDESVPGNVQILSENRDDTHKDDAPCKKKKKKKHRHDSEKSDKHDPCTLAFQKLIDTSNDDDKSKDSTEKQLIKDDIVTNVENELHEVPVINPIQICEEIKLEESKISHTTDIKKKNKKGKKNPPEEHICVETDKVTIPEKNILDVSKSDNIPLENRKNEKFTEEISPKPKAKIVKPVQKKRHNKPESYHDLDMNTSENFISEISKEVIEKPINILENKSYSLDNEIIKEAVTTSSTPELLKTVSNTIDVIEIDQCQSHKQDINELEDSSVLVNISKNNQDGETSTNYDELGFVEVKAMKGKKKRNKNALTPDTPETIEIKTLETEKDTQNVNMKCFDNKNQIKSEEVESLKMITPDIIEYPRSTSQQYVDGNNNTLIQEITSTEEVKLGSPLYIPTPIIHGSGESPEEKSSEPLVLNVTEIDSRPSSSKDEIKLLREKDQTPEKTDIKSKMIEVNRDMEELRRSIERSLAELTAVDKNDKKVEKKIETQSTELTETENTNIESSNQRDIKDVENSKNTVKVNENLKSVELVDVVSDDKVTKTSTADIVPPVCPARRDKSKTKSKKKGKKDLSTTSTTTPLTSSESASTEKDTNQKTEKSEQKPETPQKTGKQQTLGEHDSKPSQNSDMSFEPIENFEDALTSSVDDINQTFEIIAKDATQSANSTQYYNNPKINIISPVEDTEGEEKHEDDNETKKRQNPISRPKNLLGHPKIPASSNETDFKKEKSKPPNSIQAKVKIKDSVEIENATNKKSEIDNKKELIKESTYLMKTNEDLIYKYSFRKVFLQSACHVCKKDLVHRVSCKFCSLVFYCSQKHKDEDWSHHQSLCFAVSTIAHLKEQKHIYADAQNISGHNYRVLRMQTILSCEKILNRKLVPWEQEALLYPRICADMKCRQWKQEQLKDCAGCGQISYCIDYPEHLPLSHQRWCKSYALYQKLVNYQLMKRRLEPPLPTRVLNRYKIPGKINDVLGSMYEEKIDMDDIQYAALTQIATAPLTAAYSHQLHSSKMNSTCANGVKVNSTFTIHTVGAELPFEADSLNKWEKFFLHLRSDVQDLRVVMVGPDINSSKLPLDLLGKIKLCEICRKNKRRVSFDFHENENYHDYYLSDGFVTPDIICAFNPNIHRSSAYNTQTWPSTINCILKQRVPFVLTSYSIEELRRDLGKVRECARVDFNVVSEIKCNPFGSVRPDRNFITDHEIPLLFKNYSFCILCGTL